MAAGSGEAISAAPDASTGYRSDYPGNQQSEAARSTCCRCKTLVLVRMPLQYFSAWAGVESSVRASRIASLNDIPNQLCQRFECGAFLVHVLVPIIRRSDTGQDVA